MKNRIIVLNTTQKLLIVSFIIVAVIAVIYFEINQYRDRQEAEAQNKIKSEQIDDLFEYYVERNKNQNNEVNTNNTVNTTNTTNTVNATNTTNVVNTTNTVNATNTTNTVK